MTRILVTYATMAGSTADVAQVVAEELNARGFETDVLPASGVNNLEAYDGIVAGGPMIMGWHREALGFLKRHRRALQHKPFAVFVLAISLTKPEIAGVDGVSVCIDEQLAKAPRQPGKLSLRERYATLPRYLGPILSAVRPAKPASIGVFGGRLEYGRLKWWAVMFVTMVIQAPAGDRRNWEAIRAWAAEVAESMTPSKPTSKPLRSQKTSEV